MRPFVVTTDLNDCYFHSLTFLLILETISLIQRLCWQTWDPLFSTIKIAIFVDNQAVIAWQNIYDTDICREGSESSESREGSVDRFLWLSCIANLNSSSNTFWKLKHYLNYPEVTLVNLSYNQGWLKGVFQNPPPRIENFRKKPYA